MAKKKDQGEIRYVARNKKAGFRFTILERFEAGIVLVGTEVKSIRAGGLALADAFARFRGDELWLLSCRIAPYEMGGHQNHDPTRPRKLLMRRRELGKIRKQLDQRGLTLIPLSVYFKNGRAKVELGIAQGKQLRDRREDMKKKDAEREMRRATHRSSLKRS